MTLLNELMIRHGADKASSHPVKGHDYARHYARAFAPLRREPLKLLEIGVGSGCSHQAWLEYFPNALVWGVDQVHDTNPWNTPGAKTHERYTFIQGPQESDTFWACFLADHGADWDIVIDDGGHMNDQVIVTFRSLWRAMRSGGLYCIEDLGVGYGAGSVFFKPEWPTHMTFIKDRLDEINLSDTIDWLNFSKELAILCKK